MQLKKILITTPQVYSKRLQQSLENYGFKVFVYPGIITEIITNEEFKELFEHFDEYSFIILPSRNAIKSFFYNATVYGFREKIPATAKFATIGRDAKLLESYGFSDNLQASEASTDGLVRALKNRSNISKIAVITPKVEIISEPYIIPKFISDLKSFVQVTAISGYVTKPNFSLNIENLRKLLNSSEVDAILFTSAGEIEALEYLLGGKNLLSKTKIICFGPYTAKAAFDKGLKVFYTGKNFHSFDSFAQELASL